MNNEKDSAILPLLQNFIVLNSPPNKIRYLELDLERRDGEQVLKIVVRLWIDLPSLFLRFS